MKAPDTIYIPIVEEEGKKLLCTNWWETDTSSRNAYVNETIPYIRKEAILEWLDYLKGKVVGDEKRVLVLSIIDKINSL